MKKSGIPRLDNVHEERREIPDRLGALFCDVDDFCLEFEPQFHRRLRTDGARSRNRHGRLSLSEMVTIVVAFQMSHYRDFKASYNNLQRTGSGLFPGLSVTSGPMA